MKTAATGEPYYADEAQGKDLAHGLVRWPLAIQSERMKDPVKVVIEMDGSTIVWMIAELQGIARARATAHENTAKSLRESAAGAA